MQQQFDVDEISTRLADLGFPSLPEPLPAAVTDAHTHMDTTTAYAALPADLNLASARAVGVHRMVQIGCDVPGSRWAVDLAAQEPRIIAAVAVHPNDVARSSDEQCATDLAAIEQLASAGDHVRAVGECGLDYFRTDPRTDAGLAGIERQKWAFRRHIEIANAHHLTLAIHARRAEAKKAVAIAGDALAHAADILDEVGWPQRVIWHCFSGDVEFAERCIAADSWLSFAGNVTYPANQQLRDALAIAPRDRILVETDAPFLTPLPHRGESNAPYVMAHTVRFIADQLGMDLAECCALLDANAAAAYGGDWGRDG